MKYSNQRVYSSAPTDYTTPLVHWRDQPVHYVGLVVPAKPGVDTFYITTVRSHIHYERAIGARP